MCTSRAAGVASAAGGASSQGGTVDGKVFSEFVFAGAGQGGGGHATADNDLDFLDDGGTAPVVACQRAPVGQQRRGEADRVATELASQPQAAADLWRACGADPRLGLADGDGIWVLCAAALCAAESAGGAGAGPDWTAGAVATLAARAVDANDSELAWQGVQLALRGTLVGLQGPLAAALDRHLPDWHRERRAAVLAFLEAHGDGRCVRPLEALLARQGSALDDALAYKARHVVQVIRRSRRK